jgi:DNA-binding response OmpR family regulator
MEYQTIQLGSANYNYGYRKIYNKEKQKILFLKEHQVFLYLYKKFNRPVTVYDIMDDVYDNEKEPHPDNITLIISRLRKKIIDFGLDIVCIRKNRNKAGIRTYKLINSSCVNLS